MRKPDYEANGVRLYCGDCLEILPELEAGSVDAVVTSPPYGLKRLYSGEVFDWDATLDALSIVPASESCQQLVNLGLVHEDGEVVPYWESWRERMRLAGWRFFGWYVWDQGDGLPGDWNGRLAPSHEFVFHFNRAAKKPNKIVATKSRGRRLSGTSLRKPDLEVRERKSQDGMPVNQFKIPDSVIRVYREMRRDVDHPARFPVGLPQFLVAAFTQKTQAVCDPFMGSGTTGVACLRTERNFIGIEKEPKYFALAVRRIEAELNRHPLFEGRTP